LKPHHSSLFTQNTIGEKSKYVNVSNPCKTDNTQLATVHRIVQVFKGYHQKLLQIFVSAIESNSINLDKEDFDKELNRLIEECTKQTKGFANRFLNTQQFAFFSEYLMQDIRKDQEDRELLSTLDGLIAKETKEQKNLVEKLKNCDPSHKQLVENMTQELVFANDRLGELLVSKEKIVRNSPQPKKHKRNNTFLGRLRNKLT